MLAGSPFPSATIKLRTDEVAAVAAQFSLAFRGFCRRHANLRDSANRQIGSPKPFRLFPTEPARFGFAWKSSSLFKHLKIWPTEPSAADLSATKTNTNPRWT